MDRREQEACHDGPDTIPARLVWFVAARVLGVAIWAPAGLSSTELCPVVLPAVIGLRLVSALAGWALLATLERLTTLARTIWTAIGSAHPRPASLTHREDPLTHQPIGYWVKLLDRLIEASFEDLLGTQRLTRRHWQALNVVQRGPVSQQQVDEALAPFLTGPEATTRTVVDELHECGWIADNGGQLSLTDDGGDALSALRDRVVASRDRITEGISDEKYATTVDTLARMCSNLQVVSRRRAPN